MNHTGTAGVGKRGTTWAACRVLRNGAGDTEEEPAMQLLTLQEVRYLLKLHWNKHFRSWLKDFLQSTNI